MCSFNSGENGMTNRKIQPRNIKDRKALRDKIGELMALEKTEWPGDAFADEDGTFGVTCGKVKGGLYAAYFLANHLSAQKLFTGRQKARTDLDTAVYELATDNPFQLFPEVKLCWNETKELELRITTDKPLDKIILAIDSALAAEQAEIRQKEQQEREYQEGRERDRQREKRGPVVSPQADLAILQEYVEQMTRTHLPHTAFVKLTTAPIHPSLVELRGNAPPCHTFHYFTSGWGKENEFFNRTLRDVFTGFCAVSPHHNFGDKKDTLKFDIYGNPARLVQDILEHDFKAVAGVATALKTKKALSASDEAAFTKAIGEYGVKNSDVEVITKGSAEAIKVGRPLKLKGPA